MLGRKPEEFKIVDEGHAATLINLLVEVLACAKCNPSLDYSNIIRDLNDKLSDLANHELYFHVLYAQQKEPENQLYSKDIIDLICWDLNPDATKDVEFINQTFYYAIKLYYFDKEIDKHWQNTCIALLSMWQVNPSYLIGNEKAEDYLFLKFNALTSNETKADRLMIETAKKTTSLFVATADNYFRQYQISQVARLDKKHMSSLNKKLGKLFCFGIKLALFANDFALLHRFVEYKNEGFVPTFTFALQELMESFRNWMLTTETAMLDKGCVPPTGFTEKTVFQYLDTHFKPLAKNFIKKISEYSMMDHYQCFNLTNYYAIRFYHANDMMLIFTSNLSLHQHAIPSSYFENNNQLLSLLNSHALLILNTLENYICEHENEFVVNNNGRLFNGGILVTCADEEQVYLPEHIAILIETSRAASKENNKAHDLLHQYLYVTLVDAAPKGKDADKPERRSLYVHNFYTALRDENLNHPILKMLSQTVTKKIVEFYRQQKSSAFHNAASFLESTMSFAIMQLIYEYADGPEVESKDIKPATFKPLGGFR